MNKKKINPLWISWEDHRRTMTICEKGSIKLAVITTNKNKILRYLSLTFKTILMLFKTRASTLIVQNPSIVLSLITLFFKYILRYKLIIDAHNEAVVPYINTAPIFLYLTKLLHKYADLTIVTNTTLAMIVEQNKGKPFILPDGLPELVSHQNIKTSSSETITFLLIATYAADEPISEIFKAFNHFENENIQLRVTGNANKMSDNDKQYLSKNIHLLGFIPEKSFIDELNSASAIIDLTTMPDCLVCGAYEAISLEKPVILSNNKSAQSLFEKGALFTENNSDSIKKIIQTFIDNKNNISNDAKEMKTIYEERWQKELNNFLLELK